MNKHFPGAVRQHEFIASTYQKLSQQHGFNAENTLACVSVCRDELTAPLIRTAEKTWGGAFNFSSLAGFLTLGKTGFSAAHTHAPVVDGIERYVYYALPHIAIGPQGETGVCIREGREEPSIACGALDKFYNELLAGTPNLEFDPLDIEQSVLEQRLHSKIQPGKTPGLVELTKLAQQVILEELQSYIDLTVDHQTCQYAVITGIQIHNSTGEDYVWPGEMYMVSNGEKTRIAF